MPKLRMPVRYGSEIKDIEFTDFLELSDTVKSVISLPVGIKVPVRDRGIASGKLLRCDNAGALLIDKPICCQDYEAILIDLDVGHSYKEYTFAQKVYKCLLSIYLWSNVTSFYWTNSGGSEVLQEFSETEMNTLNFVGTKIWLGSTYDFDGGVGAYIVGFY